MLNSYIYVENSALVLGRQFVSTFKPVRKKGNDNLDRIFAI